MSGNVQRRLVHASGTLIPLAYLLDVVTWQHLRYVVAGGAVLAVILEYVRLEIGLDWAIYDRLTREYERDNPAGYALAVIAIAIVAWAFSPTVAVPAMIMLTIGDPVSGVLGDVDGVDDRKAWWVMLTMGVVCLGIALPFLPPVAAVAAATVAVIADAIKPRIFGFVVDDNFSIPVGAAITAWIFVTFVPSVV